MFLPARSPPDCNSFPASFCGISANGSEETTFRPCRHPLESIPRAPPPVSAPIPPVEIVVLRRMSDALLGDLLPRRLLQSASSAANRHLPQFIQRLFARCRTSIARRSMRLQSPPLRRSPALTGPWRPDCRRSSPPSANWRGCASGNGQSPADSSKAAIPATPRSPAAAIPPGTPANIDGQTGQSPWPGACNGRSPRLGMTEFGSSSNTTQPPGVLPASCGETEYLCRYRRCRGCISRHSSRRITQIADSGYQDPGSGLLRSQPGLAGSLIVEISPIDAGRRSEVPGHWRPLLV